MRLAKYLAAAGLCSRREAERRILAGRVAVAGRTVATPAFEVEGRERVEMDGRLVRAPSPSRLWCFHKPRGVLVTDADPAGRPILKDLLPATLPRVMAVGRLDFNTEGLLLLTNDGDLARALELPATGLVRRYRALVHGRVNQGKLEALAAGVVLHGVRYRPIEANVATERPVAGRSGQWLDMAFAEGKNREARKALESIGLRVARLIRTDFGPLQIGDLPPRALEEVAPARLRTLFGAHISAGRATDRNRRKPRRLVTSDA